MLKTIHWIITFILLILVLYLTYNQFKLQSDYEGFKSNYQNELISSLETGCTVYSVSNPSGTRSVTGEDICRERAAGKCLFGLRYQMINEALTGSVGASGSYLDIVGSCQVAGNDEDTVAYCCNI